MGLAFAFLACPITIASGQPLATPVSLATLIDGGGYVESSGYRFGGFELLDSGLFPNSVAASDVVVETVSDGVFEGLSFVGLNNAFASSTAGFGFNLDFVFVATSLGDPQSVGATRLEVEATLDGEGALATSGSYFDGSDTPVSPVLGAAAAGLPDPFASTSPAERLRFGVEAVEVFAGFSGGIGLGGGDIAGVTFRHFFVTQSELVPGDYDLDQDVDADDYDEWLRNFGRSAFDDSFDPTPTGDGNGDGVVDGADYTLWRDALASIASQQGNAMAVPEPGAATLLLGTVTAGLRRRRVVGDAARAHQFETR